MKLIKILDTTLRDGEQAAGVSLNPSQKLEIALQLERLGVDIIEAGFSASNEEDYKAVEMIAREVRGPIICAFGRAVKNDLGKAYESIKHAEKKRIHTFLATSKLHLDKKLKKSEEQALQMIYDGVSYAKNFGVEVEFTPEDGSRTEIGFLLKTIQTAVSAGASIINIADTVGVAQPRQFYDRVYSVYQHFQKEIASGRLELSVHCHNDKGNAVANTLQGVLAGATQVECTINGIGERTGNAALEEVVMNIETDKEYFNAFTNINTKELFRTSMLVSQLTGLFLAKNKPIVGENAFCHESGIHQHGVMADPKTYEIISPESVGWMGERFVVGKHSGKHVQEYLKTKNNLNAVNQ
jgi:2-isopropylmalate synthase